MKKLKPLEKYPGESRLYSFDFSDQPEIVAGAILVGVPVVTATPAGLTIGSAVVAGAGKLVNVPLSGGTISGGPDPTVFLCECVVSTNGGAILNGFGKLSILNQDQL
jgi:hypothetical protein